jgi:hypothetical protein
MWWRWATLFLENKSKFAVIRYDLLDLHSRNGVLVSGPSADCSTFWVVLAWGALKLHMLQKLHTFTTQSGVLFSFFSLKSQSNTSNVCDIWGPTIALIATLSLFSESVWLWKSPEIMLQYFQSEYLRVNEYFFGNYKMGPNYNHIFCIIIWPNVSDM